MAAETRSTYRSFRELVKASWVATAGERPRFFAFVTLFIVAYSLDLLIPWAIGYTLSVFVQEGISQTAYNHALWGIGAYMALRLAYTFCHHLGRYIQMSVAYSARMETLTRLFDAFLTYPLNWHVSHHSGENLSKIHRSTGAIDSTIGTYVWQIIEGMVKVVFASIAIFALDFWVAVNVFVMSMVTITFMIMFNKRLVARIRKNNAFYDKINRICVDYLFNIVTVKTLSLEKAAKGYLRNHRDDGLLLARKISKYSELKWGSTGVGYAIVIGSSLMIYFHGHQNDLKPFDVAQVYVLLNYLDKIFAAIGSFTGYYGGLIEASTAYEDATEILEQSALIAKREESVTFDRRWNTLTMKELSFSYGKDDKSVLQGVDVEIHRGDKIAIVGPSGGGKSTFLKILGGLLIPDKCVVATDKQPLVYINDIANVSLLLPQEPEIFSESVLYNLTMGESFSPAEIKFFTELCRVDKVIAKLPDGLDHNLAEKGLNLSVGEKQRVAMTRGLLRVAAKDILLLDEPTSSLDPKTEKEIFMGLIHHFTDRTIITACHRLALVPLFDKIIYVRHGLIEEVGSFEELLARQGSFWLAWSDYEKRVVKDHAYDGSQQII